MQLKIPLQQAAVRLRRIPRKEFESIHHSLAIAVQISRLMSVPSYAGLEERYAKFFAPLKERFA
jgi:hypothetical protein